MRWSIRSRPSSLVKYLRRFPADDGFTNGRYQRHISILRSSAAALIIMLLLFVITQTEQLAFLWILLILIVVGNMSVLLALSMSTARKSRMNYFIKHLAIAGSVQYSTANFNIAI